MGYFCHFSKIFNPSLAAFPSCDTSVSDETVCVDWLNQVRFKSSADWAASELNRLHNKKLIDKTTQKLLDRVYWMMSCLGYIQ